ncbi:MAG: hypothetical protein NTZ04_07000 [Chloroflexi bacterium]|nr:hypothetical protein [Chloroflexota bacterium]
MDPVITRHAIENGFAMSEPLALLALLAAVAAGVTMTATSSLGEGFTETANAELVKAHPAVTAWLDNLNKP